MLLVQDEMQNFKSCMIMGIFTTWDLWNTPPSSFIFVVDELFVLIKLATPAACQCKVSKKFWKVQRLFHTILSNIVTGKKAKYSDVFRALYGRNKLHIPTRIATPNMAGNITNIPWYYLCLYGMEYCGYYWGIYAWKYSWIRNMFHWYNCGYYLICLFFMKRFYLHITYHQLFVIL